MVTGESKDEMRLAGTQMKKIPESSLSLMTERYREIQVSSKGWHLHQTNQQRELYDRRRPASGEQPLFLARIKS